MDEFDWVQSSTALSYGTTSNTTADAPYDVPIEDLHGIPEPTLQGSFASFVCHVTNLERKLRSFSNIVLDASSDVRVTGKLLGKGKTFMVRHALWKKKPNEPPVEVALKEIVPDMQMSNVSSMPSSSSPHRSQTSWKDILFEIRALLHEPIRYHPNLVRLLGIQWGLSPISESTFPILIMEYASLGTFSNLQSSSAPLSFGMKQKLCYDVSRGLSALHASGIAHGDMKHENVLIFPSKKPLERLPYTAKLADFGGSMMDMTEEEFKKVETWTWPFQAPEITSDQPLSRSGIMLTDVYSFGLLIWRALMDGEGFISLPGATQDASDVDKRGLIALKSSESFTGAAIAAVNEYASENGLSRSYIEMFTYAILHTVRLRPEDRSLLKAQSVLRGIQPHHVPAYLNFVEEKNKQWESSESAGAPGRHGITRDSLAFAIGRSGKDADLQDNIPGYRPQLGQPKAEEFLFEPESLKKVLTWDQQRQMLDELKAAASSEGTPSNDLLNMGKTVASFYVFQCYLLEFGTTFNGEEAIHWLQKASVDDYSHEDADYLAQAWVWRLSQALSVEIPIEPSRLDSLLRLSVMRGHRTCLQDMLDLASSNSEPGRQSWNSYYQESRRILQTQMGAVGMGYFFSSFLTQPWNNIDINNIPQLDNCIRAVIWNDYEATLRNEADQDFHNAERSQRTAFDNIYVNRRGHGLLHWAAARGATEALRHMMNKYKCNIDLPNQHVDETPLLCACAAGNLDASQLLIERGADPNGHKYSQESPLHWLSSFATNDMETIAKRLIDAGADVEMRSGSMRHDVRGIRADWEHIFEVRTTPLGRAVFLNNLQAVKVLLKNGANPLAKTANLHRGEWESSANPSKMVSISSPFDLAAILCLPEILAAFVIHISQHHDLARLKLLDDLSMLRLAHGKTAVSFDTLSLQSRLVRGGVKYKSNLSTTLSLLHALALSYPQGSHEELMIQRTKVLCKEVELGNIDVVESLLNLKYDADGTHEFRPLAKAVWLNHEEIFKLLIRYGANCRIIQQTPTGTISLLHICASRPRKSRPGRNIADALIAAGVPVESEDARSKPPLAMAVLNQNFDVASALVDNGANVDAVYPVTVSGYDGPEARNVNVLVEVLSQHTMHTLESLRFLFGKQGGSLSRQPAFYVDPGNRLSILHFLAGSPHFTQVAQITPKILNLCLQTYGGSDLINYRHPVLGTALYYAASMGHKAMVERLLQYGAITDANAGPDVDDSVQVILRPKETFTPLWAALLRLDDELKRGVLFPDKSPPGAWLKSDSIHNTEKIIAMLSHSNRDEMAIKAIERVQNRKTDLEEESRKAKTEQKARRKSVRAKDDERPVDLGILGGSGTNEEQRIQEIRAGPEEEWRSEELGRLLENFLISK